MDISSVRSVAPRIVREAKIPRPSWTIIPEKPSSLAGPSHRTARIATTEPVMAMSQRMPPFLPSGKEQVRQTGPPGRGVIRTISGRTMNSPRTSAGTSTGIRTHAFLTSLRRNTG